MNGQYYRCDIPLFELSYEKSKKPKDKEYKTTYFVTEFKDGKILRKRFFDNRHKAREYLIEQLKRRLL